VSNFCVYYNLQCFCSCIFKDPYVGTQSQLLQFEPTKALNFIKIPVTLQHTSSYMFQASMAYHQGADNCRKHLLIIFRMQQSCKKLPGVYIHMCVCVCVVVVVVVVDRVH